MADADIEVAIKYDIIQLYLNTIFAAKTLHI